MEQNALSQKEPMMPRGQYEQAAAAVASASSKRPNWIFPRHDPLTGGRCEQLCGGGRWLTSMPRTPSADHLYRCCHRCGQFSLSENELNRMRRERSKAWSKS